MAAQPTGENMSQNDPLHTQSRATLNFPRMFSQIPYQLRLTTVLQRMHAQRN